MTMNPCKSFYPKLLLQVKSDVHCLVQEVRPFCRFHYARTDYDRPRGHFVNCSKTEQDYYGPREHFIN